MLGLEVLELKHTVEHRGVVFVAIGAEVFVDAVRLHNTVVFCSWLADEKTAI